jgi:hypothetical protein
MELDFLVEKEKEERLEGQVSCVVIIVVLTISLLD